MGRNLNTPDVTAEIAIDHQTPVVHVKIQAVTYELNVFLNSDDVDTLLASRLPLAPDERALCIGESCGAPAYWSRDDNGTMGVALGFDDTSWDFGAWMPTDTFDAIRALVGELQPKL